MTDQPPPGPPPADLGAHIRMMCDMMALAFQADLTRICTFMIANDGSSLLNLQRTALIPLELSLLGGEIPSPTTPIGIIHLVRRTLHTPRLPGA